MYQTQATTSVRRARGNLLVTIFDGLTPPMTYALDDFGKDVVTFGRSPANDIVLNSAIVTTDHGRFRFYNGMWIIEDREVFGGEPSTNGLIYNYTQIKSRVLCEGDFIRIDDGVQTIAAGVLFVFSSSVSLNKWYIMRLGGKTLINIGRDPGCDIVLPHVSISKVHARIFFDRGRYYIMDNGSTTGVVVNNVRISGRCVLNEKDVISISNSKLIFTSAAISFCSYKTGISVDCADVVITRGKGRKTFVTGNHVSLNIKPGELVAIIGGSGAGKSTILNCLCGYLPPSSGDVYINGVNLYQNFNSLKKLIGYVPQSDIVYDNLTLHDMLSYTAELRLPKDTTKEEREAAIDRAIRLVELTEKKNSFIKALSGGQRKRASIAVELLSDPNLLFLDEPASGLDPGTERNLMYSLREMANAGKTVILVTHSTLQLKLCDKIVFMGKGGNLCYFGSHDEALEFFRVNDIIDVYNMISDYAPEWRAYYDNTTVKTGPSKRIPGTVSSTTGKDKPQLPVLCSRYFKLVLNDRKRFLLLLFQAPVLALLISLVADGRQFEQYDITKSLLFALSCSAFWVGMLNAIQEVCKERSIMKREFMTGLSLNSYILSKIIVLGAMCLVQSFLIVTVFSITVGLPNKGVVLPPYFELLNTTFFTAIASTAMGLFVSSLFSNADRAMTVAPILLMPQILFSGLIFKLDGITEIISWFAVCRWSMEGYGTSANLNKLPLKAQLDQDLLTTLQDGLQNSFREGLDPQLQAGLKEFESSAVEITRDVEEYFRYTKGHVLLDWFLLILFVFGFLFLARIVLQSISKEKEG